MYYKPEALLWEQNTNSLKEKSLDRSVLLLTRLLSMPKSFAPSKRCSKLQMTPAKPGTLQSQDCWSSLQTHFVA